MALIRLYIQFIQIIIREIGVSEFVDYYLNMRVDSLLFFFFCIFSCSVFVFGIYVESVLKRIRSLRRSRSSSTQSPLLLIFQESYDTSKAKNKFFTAFSMEFSVVFT
ncbi:uncharacterized protein LOC122534256 [Frieseomelitta varia]|uniref:uncharacterized protein LOC122534256 n=1 Tax=Frieseomelitta varia TaxID=561572 RepID=UPI001CB6B68C|nr:uncharacterized protein LOC122534256 [Frieseomelitta varia]